MGSGDEEPLCAGLAAGHDEAFAQLIRLYGPAMVRAAATIMGDRHDAEEVVQEVFLALVRSRQRLAAVTNLRAYLFASLRRAAIRRLVNCKEQRHAIAARARELQTTDACVSSDIQAVADAQAEAGKRLRAAVTQLPFDQREVIGLKFDAELTFREIAQLLEISPNTAASRYRYALERLRSILRELP
jgi:RNA polymerase sigma-70 factor (ECF subfamily)